MKRTIIIEIDDAGSPRLQHRPDRTIRRLLRTVADQLSWGDQERDLRDQDGNPVGSWRLTVTADR